MKSCTIYNNLTFDNSNYNHIIVSVCDHCVQQNQIDGYMIVKPFDPRLDGICHICGKELIEEEEGEEEYVDEIRLAREKEFRIAWARALSNNGRHGTDGGGDGGSCGGDGGGC